MAAWLTSAKALEDQGLLCSLSDHVLASTVWANTAKLESAW